MKSRLFFAIIIVFAVTLQKEDALHAQSENAFYVEFLGNGGIWSANYDRRLTGKGLGARVGISYFSVLAAPILTVPVMANYLLGKDGKYFEVGAGITFATGLIDFGDGFGSAVIGTMSFMYRRQPVEGGFMWKIGLTPVINAGGIIPYWPGLAIGYCW